MLGFKADIWLVCDKYIPNIEIDGMKLVLPQAPIESSTGMRLVLPPSCLVGSLIPRLVLQTYIPRFQLST
jgi:hypothetical protein